MMVLPIGDTPGAFRALVSMPLGDLVILATICRYAARAALDENQSALGAAALADARRMDAEVSRRAHAAMVARGDA